MTVSKFKTATPQQREQEVHSRSQSGLPFLNSELGFKTFNPIEGDNAIRIVPPPPDCKDSSLWGLDAWVVHLNGRGHLSPALFNKSARDPAMDMYNKLKQTDADAASKFKASKRALMFVIDINSGDEELKVWSAPASVVDEILKVAKNRKTGALIAIEDPNEGRVIFFSKGGQGIMTRYTAFAVDDTVYPLTDAIGDQLVTFRELLVVPTPEEMDEEVRKAAESEGTDTGSSDRPVARTRRTEEAAAPTAATTTQAPQEAAVETQKVAPAAQTPQETPKAAEAPAGDDDLQARVRARIAARAKPTT